MKDLFVTREYKNSYDLDEDFFNDENLNSRQSSILKNKDQFLGKFLSNKKINLFFILMVIILLVLLGRTFQLQVVQGAHYSQLAEYNRVREKTIISSRGLIYDSQMKPLVKNIPIFDASIIPRDLSLNTEKRTEQLNIIAQAIILEPKIIEEFLAEYPKNYKYHVAVKENIGYEEALLLKIKSQQIPGLYVETRNQRQYLEAFSFSHLLGYLGKITQEELDDLSASQYLLSDYIGKTGLELFYEPVLRGKYGREEIEVDVTGQEIKVLNHQDAVNGKNLVLTIDSQMQDKVRQITTDFLKKINKTKASVVILNPQNGEILTLLSLPDYDINLFAGGISKKDYNELLNNEDNPLFNRSIKGEYPSGSTIKPVVGAGALQEEIVTDRTSFYSTGGLWLFDRWFFPDWSAGGHGQTNIYRAIAWSVNTYFYIIGGGYEDFFGLGEAGLKKYFRLFGLGEKTGLDLVGEAKGLVPDPEWKKRVKNEDWYIGDTYHMAIGQGDVLVTPLQVANFTSFFANGGKLYQPHLVKKIFSAESEEEIKPSIINQDFIDPKNTEIIKKAMRQTITDGSAEYLGLLKVDMAGKTGTAQWHSTKDNHAWFTGFAPYENPEIVITVLIEEGGEGSSVAVPLTYEILDWYFNEYTTNLQINYESTN